ncbi:MAG: hypothetical protein JNJ57_11255 [Saprospiraceae bacterium]|nr:hypothetical protein [Saprospiraceae bacterium]
MKKLSATLLLLLALGGWNCSNMLKNQVDNVDVEALLKKMQPQTDSLLKNAARSAVAGVEQGAPALLKGVLQGLKGAIDTLDPDIQKIMRTIDSLGTLSADQLDKISQKIDLQVAQLKSDLKDEDLKKFLLGTVEELTGKLKKETRSALSDMIQQTLDDLTTDNSREKIKIILDQWLGKETQDKAQALVNAALKPTLDTLLGRIDKIVHKDVPFVQRQANKLLWTLGILSACIIGFVYYQRRKYARLVNLLTYSIHKIPSKDMYDELTKRIQDDAQRDGMESFLREVLKEQGLNAS